MALELDIFKLDENTSEVLSEDAVAILKAEEVTTLATEDLKDSLVDISSIVEPLVLLDSLLPVIIALETAICEELIDEEGVTVNPSEENDLVVVLNDDDKTSEGIPMEDAPLEASLDRRLSLVSPESELVQCEVVLDPAE